MSLQYQIDIKEQTSNNHGDQRGIFVQGNVNKRRRKRKGKKKFKSKIPTIERVIYILETGKLKDFTHPKEVDPYWGNLYKQYEYLCYMNFYIRKVLKLSKINNPTVYICKDIEILLLQVEKIKQRLFKHMINAMFIMYGSVIQSRFYGWKKYSDEFTSAFNEISASNIKNIRFDIDRTRCSVYFYQAFWLNGLSIIKKISDRLKKQYEDNEQIFANKEKASQDYEKEFSDYIENETSKFIDNFNALENNKRKRISVDTEIEMIKAEVRGELPTVKENETDTEEELLNVSNNDSQEMSPTQKQILCENVLKSLLEKLNIDIDYIYGSNTKNLESLVRFIRKKIRKNEIEVTKDMLKLQNLFRKTTF